MKYLLDTNPFFSAITGDPFDRILLAQSIEERMPLISADVLFKKYPVEVIW